MIIIAFAPNTSKKLPQLLCRAPRHCAPIICVSDEHYIMYQFVRRKYIAQISLTPRTIKLLGAHGWIFIKINRKIPHDFMRRAYYAASCVALCKIAVNIRAPYIITPRQMYKKLRTSSAQFNAPNGQTV